MSELSLELRKLENSFWAVERMVKQWCVNGTMVDTDKFSSPVPLIGLYTAAATLVCLILISFDMWDGFRRRKLWLPCRFFSLNSVTLTLISISSKLPVDLTSSMPSSEDQLSKLTGTVFICMSMGFLMPSLGIIGETESQANLLALSIFVVTVAVNICIQIATGVISSFINHPKAVEKPIEMMVEPQAELEHALQVVCKFHRSFQVVVARDEARAIGSTIRSRSYTSLNELSDLIKLLFVNTLGELLAEFPKAIFNHIADSPVEEFEDRVRLGLKLICKLESIEPDLRWSFPAGSNITSLVNDQVSPLLTENNSLPVEVENDDIIGVNRQDDNV